MKPIQTNSSNKPEKGMKNIGMVETRHALSLLLKIIAYLVVVAFSIAGGIALVASLIPGKTMGNLITADYYDWKNLNFQYIGQMIGVLSSTIAFRYFVDKQNYQSLGLGFKRVGMDLLVGILWAIAILTTVFLIVWGLGGISVLGTQKLGIALLGYLSFFLLVAIVEEVVFRGYLLQMLTDHLNYKVGIVVSAIGFALVHLGNAHFTWIAFCNLTLGASLMSLFYLKYHSLYVPIGFHWLWNYFQGNILGFEVSGTDVLGILQIEIGTPEWLSGGSFGLEGSIITSFLLLIINFYVWFYSYTFLEGLKVRDLGRIK